MLAHPHREIVIFYQLPLVTRQAVHGLHHLRVLPILRSVGPVPIPLDGLKGTSQLEEFVIPGLNEVLYKETLPSGQRIFQVVEVLVRVTVELLLNLRSFYCASYPASSVGRCRSGDFALLKACHLFTCRPSIDWLGLKNYEIALLLKVLDQGPKMAALYELHYVLILEVVAHRWAACQIEQGLRDQATAQLLVATVQLGVGFLKQGHPEVFFDGLRVDWLTLRVAGNQVVDRHFFPSSALAKFKSIQSLWIALLGNKETFEKLRALCKD